MKNDEYIRAQSEICIMNGQISPRLYEEYGVNLGLRDENGKGVLTGLTKISKIVSNKVVNNKTLPCEGELWYRGYPIESLINSLEKNEIMLMNLEEIRRVSRGKIYGNSEYYYSCV